MASRIDFDNILKAIPGIDHVYFQPPESMKIEYPCIIYTDSQSDPQFADDEVYLLPHRYVVRLVCHPKDFDGPLKDRIAKILKTPMRQTYQKDRLYHCIYEKIY
jgi:hypothetical protein